MQQGRREREKIAGRTGLIPADTFWSHIGGCADHAPGRGDPVIGLVGRDAEVREFDGTVSGDQDVRRFDVAVQNSFAVSVHERVQQRDTDPGDLGLVQRTVLRDHRRQRTSWDQIHHDPLRTVVLDQVVHGDHMGMGTEPGGVARFAAGTFDQQLAVLGREVVRNADLLEGTFDTGAGVDGPPDRPHPARAEPFDQPEPPADQVRDRVPASRHTPAFSLQRVPNPM